MLTGDRLPISFSGGLRRSLFPEVDPIEEPVEEEGSPGEPAQEDAPEVSEGPEEEEAPEEDED